MSGEARISAILAYWFGDPPHALQRASSLWFTKLEATDAFIREHFLGDLERAIAGELEGWTKTPRGTLALVVLLDQFSRNLFRGQPLPFELGPRALTLALGLIDSGAHRSLTLAERSVLYLPLEHAEDLALQERAVELFAGLVPEAPPEDRALYEEFVDYARQHRDIIARFGRFPHRNATLGRSSTPEELTFLTQPGSSF